MIEKHVKELKKEQLIKWQFTTTTILPLSAIVI